MMGWKDKEDEEKRPDFALSPEELKELYVQLDYEPGLRHTGDEAEDLKTPLTLNPTTTV